jgi:transcriptional regulator with XRE-family HTH domain
MLSISAGYTHADIRVNSDIRKRIGETAMTDLSAAMNEIIAANVKTLRERLGLNQDELADEMEVGQASVSRWEKGSEPKAESLSKLAQMAGCSVPEFTTQLLTSRPRAGELRSVPQTSATLLLPVYLPSEDALTDMFAALLDPLKNERNPDVIARRLAQRLPIALAQTVSRSTSLQPGLAGTIPEASYPASHKANSER